MRKILDANSCKTLKNSRDERVYNTYSTQKIQNHTHFTSNQTGYHRFKSQLPLKATWKVSKSNLQRSNPKNNLSHNEYKALRELVNNTEIILKKADKGTTTVIMNKCDKTQEAQTHLNNREHYKLLKNAMAEETLQRVNELVTRLHQNNFIDDMTKKWFSQTRNPPRIPIFYTLTKIHKQKPVSRPIISGCEGLSERLSSSVDKLLQPIAQTQKSYLKDTTHFINFIEKTKVLQNTILVSMDVTSLYTNIPQEEGITTVCKAYEKFHNYNPPIPSHHLKEMLCLILKENSFQFYWKKLPPDPWNRNRVLKCDVTMS
ncbi:uncharacterized protein [Montipora foliosa]|uniref:uncharacterized protein n=1 Tax=Montipora foliosa TaxID=591990 RepID=UPI0035F13458